MQAELPWQSPREANTPNRGQLNQGPFRGGAASGHTDRPSAGSNRLAGAREVPEDGRVIAIELASISKRFGRGNGQVQALDTLSLSVPQGGVFGLLGPNGAGKSTLLRVIAGLVHQDEGTVRLLGEEGGPVARRRLGALIDAPLFYPFLTARELLLVLARTSHVSVDPLPLLRRVGLADAADRRIAGFSLGMKQRLGIAAALLGNPEIVILDEPTNGLDPEGMREMRALLRTLADRDGITVLLSSHLLDEVERVCDRVAILRRGRLAAQGKVSDLLKGERLWLDASPADRVLARLGDRGIWEGGGVVAHIGRDEAPSLIAALVAERVEIHEARWLRADLEEIFLAETREPA
jgi:ABC-2 type transport system ATP-binding protein